jgi:predicted secreted Zn-dependent protease
MMFGRSSTGALRFLATGIMLALFSCSACAQLSIIQTTNYYSVTGANFREIRQSISEARPWKDGFDGDTRWTVEWKFNSVQTAAGCACSSSSTTTRIVTTLPRWIPSADVAPEVKERWTNYFIPLAQHEAGHARIGMAAATEVLKTIATIDMQPDCDRLKKLINERAERVVDDYRGREKEYDRRTEHGTKPLDAR